MINDFAQFRNEVRLALGEIGKKYGVDILPDKIKYDAAHVELMVQFRYKGESGNSEQNMFEQYCKLYGLKPSDYGKKFRVGDKVLTLIGFLPTARKYHYKFKDENGNLYKTATYGERL